MIVNVNELTHSCRNLEAPLLRTRKREPLTGGGGIMLGFSSVGKGLAMGPVWGAFQLYASKVPYPDEGLRGGMAPALDWQAETHLGGWGESASRDYELKTRSAQASSPSCALAEASGVYEFTSEEVDTQC